MSSLFHHTDGLNSAVLQLAQAVREHTVPAEQQIYINVYTAAVSQGAGKHAAQIAAIDALSAFRNTFSA